MKAIRIHQHGGPEVLSYDEVPKPDLAPGHVLVRVVAAGVNFIDVYHRTGLYPVTLPYTLGQEGVGEVELTGEGTRGFARGDIVAWTNVPGSYAQHVSVPASHLVVVPRGVAPELAGAVMLQGMTAHYLASSTFPLAFEHTCLIYAAAGGVGSLLTQIAKLRGATVIGAVSSEEKAQLATQAGADHIIRYDQIDVATEIKRITHERGVDVVYDAVGRATWESSLNSVRKRGTIVSFGNASGPVGTIDPLILARKGSLFLTRPMLAHYIASRDELEWRARDVFNWISEGKLHVRIDRELPLAQAADAHGALESRQTAGKVLLIP